MSADVEYIRAALAAAVCDDKGISGHVAQTAIYALDRLAADLEAVRRVEVAMDTMEVDKSNDGRFRAFNLSRSVLVFADSIPALGSALAEREVA